MAEIYLHSPVGEEAPHAEGLVPLPNPKGSRLAFLFNGHVSVIPFWRHLEEEIKLRCEPADTVTVVKPNTFSPAGASTIQELSGAELALVGVCA